MTGRQRPVVDLDVRHRNPNDTRYARLDAQAFRDSIWYQRDIVAHRFPLLPVQREVYGLGDQGGSHGLRPTDDELFRYRYSRPNDAGLRQRLRELSSERRQFGYRRLHLLIKREGVELNWKRL